MKPTSFEGQSKILNKPSNMTDQECSPLPVAIIQHNTVVSCWKMSIWERLKCLVTGRVWLGVLSGATQPPVYLTVEKPFKIVKVGGV